MPNNADIYHLLTDDMTLDRELGDGTKLYTLSVLGTGEQKGSYLYRSMTLEEAKNWFTPTWLPSSSGIPWSTNWKYSRDKYLKDDSTVQLEVPAHDILTRIRTVGANPKYEGDGETWGVGPSTETGWKPSGAANKALQALYKEYSDKGSTIITPGLGKAKVVQQGKDVQNSLFRAMFRDKVMQARVVARRF